MSSSGGPAAVEAPRRHLSSRQAATVERLVEAALEEVRAVGFDTLTVRSVARRAEVAPATAYTYFTSKEHLITEVFWRRIRALAEPDPPEGLSPRERTVRTLSDFARVAVGESALAAACSVAMLAPDPDVKLLRDRIGAEIRRRLVLALGEGADPAVLATLELTVTGALVQAGMGHLSYDDLPEQFATVARLVVPDHPDAPDANEEEARR